MNPALDWRPSAPHSALVLRARLYAIFRSHFSQTGALEVETPILSRAGTTDVHIESFSTRFAGHVDAGPPQRFLRTSPEFALKRLLAAGLGDCYELARVFRDGEAGGRHNPEFTLLEWYRVGWSLRSLIDETVHLITAGMALCGHTLTCVDTTYREIFNEALGLDPLQASDTAIRAAAGGINVNPDGLLRDDWLDLLFTHRIQTAFPSGQLTVVRDYPPSQCALARIAEDAHGDQVAKRFEIYVGDLELANGYDELVDADEQARRQAEDQSRRALRGMPGPPSDRHLIAALRHGMPEACGVALGVDRLLMQMQRTTRIESVLAFNFQRA